MPFEETDWSLSSKYTGDDLAQEAKDAADEAASAASDATDVATAADTKATTAAADASTAKSTATTAKTAADNAASAAATAKTAADTAQSTADTAKTTATTAKTTAEAADTKATEAKETAVEALQKSGYIQYDEDTATLTLGAVGDPSKVQIDNDSMDIVVDGTMMQQIATDGFTGRAILSWNDGTVHTNELVTVFQTGIASTLGFRKPDSVIGQWSNAEGYNTEASGPESHAEGLMTKASEFCSHSEGQMTVASNSSSHAEGQSSEASGHAAHSEGQATVASGARSHAEGLCSEASGDSAHAEGYHTQAKENYSHAEGYVTVASGDSQHVSGKYNIADTTSAEIIGNGTDGNLSNARTLDWDGNEWIAGALSVGNAAQTRTNLGFDIKTYDVKSKITASGATVNTAVLTVYGGRFASLNVTHKYKEAHNMNTGSFNLYTLAADIRPSVTSSATLWDRGIGILYPDGVAQGYNHDNIGSGWDGSFMCTYILANEYFG